MNISLKYTGSALTFKLPEGIEWQILTRETAGGGQNESEILQNAVVRLSKALDSVAGSSLLLIVPDHTRRCGIDRILAHLLPALKKWEKIEILVANGSHVCVPEKNIKTLVGDAVYAKYPVSQHDYLEKNSLVRLGDTTFGTPVWMNKKVKQADFIVTVGGVLYHYFAGFGGGPKMLMPGVAGEETIRLNHRRTIDPQTGMFHEECYEGNIDTNPVFLDLAQVLNFVPNVLSFQVVLDPDGKIVKAEAGPVLEIHRKICDTVKDIYSMPVAQKADVVIAGAGGYPTDVNLIQSHKAIHHAFQAVKEGGVLIIAAGCDEGIGSKTFLPYFKNKTSRDIGRELLHNYQINGHTALTLKSKAEKSKIILVSELDPQLVRETGMIPAGSMEEAWSMAKKWLTPDSATGYVLPEAQIYVPVLETYNVEKL